MLVGATKDNGIVTTFDEKTFTPKVRDTLAGAGHWAMAAEDETDAKFGDILESRGGIHVKLQKLPRKSKEMMVSERREALAGMCTDLRPDIALIFASNPRKETGTFGQALMGRTQYDLTGTAYLLSCGSMVHQTFDYSVRLDIGHFYGAGNSPAEINMRVVEQFADKLLVAMGK